MVGADYQDFLSATFCRTVPKKFVEESFSVSKFPGVEKIFCIRRVCHDFLVNIFVSQYQENS